MNIFPDPSSRSNQKEENSEEEEEQFIDPNDLIIITDTANWKPTAQFINAYANQLEFDVENDPPELLNIAEKYLSIRIPNHWRRAFTKDNYQLIYIDVNTNEIHLTTDIEEKAKEEYKQLKNEYLKKLKEQEDEANKVKVIPRKKIAPLGGDKVIEDLQRKKETEFVKQIEKQNQMKNKNNDNLNVVNNDKNNNDDEIKIEDYNIDNDEKKHVKGNESIQLKLNDDGSQGSGSIKENSENNSLNNSNNIIINNENNLSDEDNKKMKPVLNNDKESDKKKKKDYLKRIKEKFRKLKNNTKNYYINNKKDFIENTILDNKNKLESEKKKNKNNLTKDQKNDLKQYENELIKKMNNDLENYKNKLTDNFSYENELNENNDLDNGSEVNTKKQLELKKLKLESLIRIQKEKNKSKKDIQLIKSKNEIKRKINQTKEIYDIKKSRLELQNKNKMNTIENDFKTKFDNYVHEMNNDNNLIFNKNLNNDLNENLINDNKINEQINKYMIELNDKFEQDKKTIKKEMDKKLMNDLQEYKIKTKQEINNDMQNMTKDTQSLEKRYYNELESMKQINDNNKLKINNITNNKINKITELFDSIKKSHLNNITNILNEIISLIKNNENNLINGNKNANIPIINNYNDLELKIDEFLTEKLTQEKLKINKMKSIINMTEKDYIDKEFKLNYLNEIASVLCRSVNDKKSVFIGISNLNDEDDSLVSELNNEFQEKYKNYKTKYNKEVNNKILYPLLEKSLQKIMDLIYNEANTNMILENSLYFNNISSLNKTTNNIFPHNMNMSYFNNSSGNNILNPNIISQRANQSMLMTNNPRFNNYVVNNQINPNNQTYNNEPMNQTVILNAPKRYYSPTPFLNKTLNNNNNLQNNISPVDDDIINICDIIPQLPEEVLANFNLDLKENYGEIVDFLFDESQKLNREMENNKYRNSINEKLNVIRGSGEYNKYNLLFNKIYYENNARSNKELQVIKNKTNIFNLIKNNVDEAFSHICENPNQFDSIKESFKTLLNSIRDYKKNYTNKITIENKNTNNNSLLKAYRNGFNDIYGTNIYNNNVRQKNYIYKSYDRYGNSNRMGSNFFNMYNY